MEQITAETKKELRALIDKLLCASNKKRGEEIRRKINLKVSSLRYDKDPGVFSRLQRAIDHAYQACGQVKDYEHWKRCSDQSWYVFDQYTKE